MDHLTAFCTSEKSNYIRAVIQAEDEEEEIEGGGEDEERTPLDPAAESETIIPSINPTKMSSTSTNTIRIQLSFEVSNCVNTRKGWKFWRDEITCPYVVVSSMNGDRKQKIGKTETAFHSLNAKFCTPVYIPFTKGITTPHVHVALYDNIKPVQQQQSMRSIGKSISQIIRNPNSDRDRYDTRPMMDSKSERDLLEAGDASHGDILLCEHTLDLGDFVNEIEKGSFGLTELLFIEGDRETFPKSDIDNYRNPSFLTICGHQSYETDQIINLQLRGLAVKNVEKGFFNLSRTDPLFIISKKHEDNTGKVHWQAVYQSEYIFDHLNPLWKDKNLNLEQLCDGDFDKTLKIELWDYETNGKNRLVAVLASNVITLNDLIFCSEGLRGNADRSKALALEEPGDGAEAKPAGELIVLKAQLQ